MKIRIMFVIVIILHVLCLGFTSEVRFRITNLSSLDPVTITAVAVSDVYNNSGNPTSLYQTEEVYIPADGTLWNGFDLIGSTNTGMGVLGLAKYKIKITVGNHTSWFYYDTRDCHIFDRPDDLPWYTSPDVDITVNYNTNDEIEFTHYSFSDGNSGTISDNDESFIIYIHWAADELGFGYFSDYYHGEGYDPYHCWEESLLEFRSKYDESDLNGTISVEGENYDTGDYNYFPNTSSIHLEANKENTSLGTPIVVHNNWNINDNDRFLELDYNPNGTMDVDANYKQQYIASFTTELPNDVTISIKDLWYVDANGNQPNSFHELTNSDYAVFKNEGDVEDVISWKYTISVPAYEVQSTSGRYVFNGWTATGATLAADPEDADNVLVRKVLFTSETPSITARYLNLDALQGTVYIDQEWDGDITLTGDLTINSDVSVSLLNNTEIQMAQYKEIKVEGELSANGATFTRDNPNNTNPSYWDWIYARPGSQVILTDCTVEGSKYGLRGYQANARAINTSFDTNYWGLYLRYCDTYYSHDNVFTGNTRGAYLYGCSVPLDDNQFTNNQYGLYSINSSGVISNNTFTGNTTAGLYLVSSSTQSLNDWQRLDILQVNNLILSTVF